MKHEVYTCDKCGKANSGCRSIWVWTDRRMDAAGSMDDEGETVDLCASCMARALTTLMDGKNAVIGHHKYGTEWVYEHTTAKRKAK